MASANNTTFGASIVPIQHRNNVISTPQNLCNESPAITPAASHEDLNTSAQTQRQPIPNVYQTPSSLEPAQPRAALRPSIVTNEKDLEAGASTPLARNEENPFTSKVSVDINKECTMWPSKQTLIDNRKAEKKRRRDGKLCGGCGPVRDFWATFTKRQKLISKIVVAILLVAAMVGIAVGVTVAVNGTVYASEDSTQRIPEA